jgi:low affinity Fe/Cu permease
VPGARAHTGERNEGRVKIPREVGVTAFDRFADEASRFVSKGAFFTICIALVMIWVPTIVLFHSVDTWQLVISTLTSVLAFLLIALLQNSERRYDQALHRKIDTLAAALADVMDYLDEADRDQLRRHVGELRASIGFEREV